MKRELAFALEVQSQLAGSLGRTRASNSRPIAANEPESNGPIDQSQDYRVRINQCNVYRRTKRLKTAMPEGESVIVEEPVCVAETGIKEESAAEVKNDLHAAAPRRFTRSALKPKAEDSEFVNGVKDEVVSEALGEESGGDVSVLGTPTKKLELKMSKKIALKKMPTTVKELFETGLLEGLPVFYYRIKKGILLWGEIKGIGILCSCSLCKGSAVITPSLFEIHARKSYRRASQYICLENGKSLLQVLEACKKSSLETLEETIQCVIGPLPINESIICQNCKGSFLRSCALNVGLLCDLCMTSTKSEASPTNTAGVKTRSSDPALTPASPKSASKCISLQGKSCGEMTKKSLRSAMVPKSTGSASVRILSRNKSQVKISKRLSKSILIPRSSKSASQQKSQWKITKKFQQLHKLVFEEGGLPDGSEVAYYSHGKKLLEGYKKGSGIFCFCCNCEVSPSTFEAHAGWASRKKPYGYIYTSNGVSLHEFALSLSKSRKYAAKDNDDLCIICADGGNLLLCDGCPRAFHKECASLSSIPRGKWYCTYCQNMFQREKFVEHNANAVAAGRVSGVDLIEQITKRCIRIVKNPEEAEVIACVLCRGYDFSQSGFGPRTVILCDQCEKEYHVGCLKKHKMADLKDLPKGKWFCCMDCRKIYSALQNLLLCGAEKLPDSLLDVIRKKHMDIGLDHVKDFDVRWKLLSSKIASRETRLLLSEAVAIFHDRFNPIIDSVTGRDFIPSMVYGRNIRGQDFGGMYCAILTVNSCVVSAGILRVFGRDIAELPLVATCSGSQGKGYFQLLFSCIEKLLAFMNVRSIVLPAAEEAESIWTDKFGFKKMSPEQLSNYRKACWQMITFQGTSMLEKVVPQCRIIRQDAAAFDVSVE